MDQLTGYSKCDECIDTLLAGGIIQNGDLDQIAHYRCHNPKNGAPGCKNHTPPVQFDKTPVAEDVLVRLCNHRLYVFNAMLHISECITLLKRFKDRFHSLPEVTRTELIKFFTRVLVEYLLHNRQNSDPNSGINFVGADKITFDEMFVNACKFQRVAKKVLGTPIDLADEIRVQQCLLKYENLCKRLYEIVLTDGVTDEVKELFRESQRVWPGPPFNVTENVLLDGVAVLSKKQIQRILDEIEIDMIEKYIQMLEKINAQ